MAERKHRRVIQQPDRRANRTILVRTLILLAVFGVEAVVFRLTLKKPENKGTPVLYAFVANTVSYVFGLWLGNVLPDLF